jgi:hypothetical protein
MSLCDINSCVGAPCALGCAAQRQSAAWKTLVNVSLWPTAWTHPGTGKLTLVQQTTASTVTVSRAHAVWPSTRWETIMGSAASILSREPWNKGKIIGQKTPFKVKDIWALRVRLQMENRVRELALFNLGIDSKLRGCDLVALKVWRVNPDERRASIWMRTMSRRGDDA